MAKTRVSLNQVLRELDDYRLAFRDIERDVRESLGLARSYQRHIVRLSNRIRASLDSEAKS